MRCTLENMVLKCNQTRTHRLHDPHCAVAQSLALLGDSWTLLVVREAFFGTRRFADFQSHLGISKNVLADRLAHLTANGILVKTDAGRFGTRFEYELSPKGRDLATVMTALRQWSDRWIFGKGNEPLLVYDTKTGKPILPLRIRRSNGEQVPASQLVFRLGPGATQEMKQRKRRMDS